MFNRTATKVAGGIAILVLLMVGLALTGVTAGPRLASATCDVKSILTYAQVAQSKGDQATADYRRAEAKVCQDEKGGTSASPSTTPKATTSASPSATSTATATTTATATVTSNTTPAASANGEEFLANRPEAEKISLDSFGPKRSLLYPSKNMDELTANEAIAEFKFRLGKDRMLTAATGAAAGLWDYSQIDAKVDEFVKDAKAWHDANNKINEWLDKGAPEIKSFAPGYYSATYAIPGATPHVRTYSTNVWRDGQKVLVVNGKIFQLICGDQEYWVTAAPATSVAMPQPSPGMGITPEGQPVPVEQLTSACRQTSTGTWVIVPNVTKMEGDQPTNSPKCQPKQPNTTPSNPPSSTPPTTPSNPPTAQKTCPPGEHPTNEGGCGKDDLSPRNSDHPTAAAPTGVETAPVKPSQTADPNVNPGTTSTQQAQGATPAPTSRSQAPTPTAVQNNPTNPATGDPLAGNR